MRDVGAAMFVAGPPLALAGVGLLAWTFESNATFRQHLPWVVPLGAGSLAFLVSPVVLGVAVHRARPMTLDLHRNRGTVLLTLSFFSYVSAAAFALNANILDGGGLIIGGGLYTVGTGLLWATANDSLSSARRALTLPLTLTPHPLRGGAGLTIAGALGRR